MKNFIIRLLGGTTHERAHAMQISIANLQSENLLQKVYIKRLEAALAVPVNSKNIDNSPISTTEVPTYSKGVTTKAEINPNPFNTSPRKKFTPKK